MGWNSWNHYQLKIDDAMIRAQALALVKSGMKDVGYQYVVIDGGWEGFHDKNGIFHADEARFPDMKALCDYVHGLGLKIGIHTSPGPTTCKGREASFGHEKEDAQTFARWGMDFVKYDWCSGDKVYQPEQMQEAYKKFADAMKSAQRPMVYSLCQYGAQDVWKWGPNVGGQMWRTTGDIADNYNSMMMIAEGQDGLEKYAGPGRWNDPDMLEIGNGGMKPDEYCTQMTLWCILAAPLFAGNDLTNMDAMTRETLTNPEVIAVDQDSAGVQGHRDWQEGPIQVWSKKLHDGSTAIAILNLGRARTAEIKLKDIGLPGNGRVRDLWLHKDLENMQDELHIAVPKHGAVLLKISEH